MKDTKNTIQNITINIQGIVQGVGFRPFVYNLANSMGIKGSVLNDSQGVTVEAEASPHILRNFVDTLLKNPPPLALIQKVDINENDGFKGFQDFIIKKSYNTGSKTVLVSPDIALCMDCLCEMEDPADPRYAYPFINCTNCGPRFTIITDVPYDRPHTSMAKFPICSLCKSQYEDPANRRFHAQPIACPQCSPQIVLTDSQGQVISEDYKKIPSLAADFLKGGSIIAVKGLGGFHLAADACSEEAVLKLRNRKIREEKPLAVMAPNLDAVKSICQMNEAEENLLTSTKAPIVLLKKLAGIHIAPSAAPNNSYLGVMLPYTPLHYLIMKHFNSFLIMTSGNLSEEPIAFKNEDALHRLSVCADYFIFHNRDVFTRCDDSVVRIVRNREYPLRRSRGYVPYPIILEHNTSEPIFAAGGELKNTFCLYRNNQAFLSHHIGDLENIDTYNSFKEGIGHLEKLLDIKPDVAVYDLHPEYFSTQYVKESPFRLKIGVQHHHAHLVSCMADNNIKGEVIGVALDGSGYGLDNKFWGFEIMTADECSFKRKFHLKYLPLAGGDKAIREPWRMAVSYLYSLLGEELFQQHLSFMQRVGENKIQFLIKMIQSNRGCYEVSSAGRFFDAVSCLLNFRDINVYEGQAAIEMEAAADPYAQGAYPYHIIENEFSALIDPLPVLASILGEIKIGVDRNIIAGRFHNTTAEMVLQCAENIREETGLNRVVLSGGVFQNMLLLHKVLKKLEDGRFQPFYHHRVPANDGGLSLGQAAAAGAYLSNAGKHKKPVTLQIDEVLERNGRC